MIGPEFAQVSVLACVHGKGALRNSPANRTDDLYSYLPFDWLQRKSLARKIRSLIAHAVP